MNIKSAIPKWYKQISKCECKRTNLQFLIDESKFQNVNEKEWIYNS